MPLFPILENGTKHVLQRLLVRAVPKWRCWRSESANVSGSASVSTTQKSFRDNPESFGFLFEDSGYEIGVEMRNWPREHKVSLNRGFFFHIFFYFGDKENRSIY